MSPAPCALAMSHDQVVRSQKLTRIPTQVGCRGTADLEPSRRDHTTDYVNEQNNQADGERVAKGDR